MINWQKIWQHFAWRNAPSTETPLSAETLQKLNDAIKSLDERIVELASKAVTRDEIVNNLLATEPNTVLAGPMGKTLGDKVDRLNLDLSRQYLSNVDVKTLDDGKYYISNPVNAPVDETILADVQKTPFDNRKSVQIIPCGSNKVYIANYYNNMWSAWDEYVLSTDLQAGRDVTKREAGKTVTKRVTFPRPFSAIPAVTVNAESADPVGTRIQASNVTSSGFTAYISSDVSADMAFDWIAVLP